MWQCVPSVFKALQLMGCPQCNGNMIGSCTLISTKNMSTREDNCKLPMINPECWEPTITCGLRVDMDLPSKNTKCWKANNQLSCSQYSTDLRKVTAWTFFQQVNCSRVSDHEMKNALNQLNAFSSIPTIKLQYEPNEKERILSIWMCRHV